MQDVTPALPRPGDVSSSMLGPYELLTPIAREEGMAVVWAVRLKGGKGGKGFQKVLALKAMHASLSGDPRFEEMFLAEAEFASRIEHPNVCAIRDLGEEQGTLYIAMDWVDGDTLASVEETHSGGLPIQFAARIAADAAMGLHAAHELRGARGERIELVHCDVSPQNILITHDGVVKVVDFGLARATLAASPSAQGDGLVGGKMSFMSPEQAQSLAVDRRTDVFALGIVLYRLIAARHPFEGDTPLERLQRVLDRERPVTPLTALRKGCPQALSDVVLRALERDPDRRFQSMEAFAVTLEMAVPEIRAQQCRSGLAGFARKAVGEVARRRRAAIAHAIQIADGLAEPGSQAPSFDEPAWPPADSVPEEVTEQFASPSNARPVPRSLSRRAASLLRGRGRTAAIVAAAAILVAAAAIVATRDRGVASPSIAPAQAGDPQAATTAPPGVAPPAAPPASAAAVTPTASARPSASAPDAPASAQRKPGSSAIQYPGF